MGRIPLSRRLALGLALGGSALPAAAQTLPPEMTPQINMVANERSVTPLLEEVTKVGELLARATAPADIQKLSLRQADALTQLVAAVKADEREPWVKQLADCLQMVCCYGPLQDPSAHTRLVELENQMLRLAPGSGLAAYVVYREMQAGYALQCRANDPNPAKVQEKWRQRLISFVHTYPRADDTPDALMELGLVDTALNRESEIRQCYHAVLDNFPDSPQAKKASGVLRRLELVGRPFALALPLLYANNSRQDEPFDIEKLHGQAVVVYCWAGDTPQVTRDLNKLTILRHQRHAQGMELLCVSMNDSPGAARLILAGKDVPGVHVFQRGGANGIWARRSGIQDTPFLLLVGKDGNVVAQGLSMSDVEKELAKQTRE